MKNVLYFIGISVFIVTLSSCQQKSQKEVNNEMLTLAEAEAQFISNLCKADTDTVINMSTQFMEKLRMGELKNAIKMLYTINGLQLDTLSTKQQRQYLQKFEAFPVRSYQLSYYSFSTQGNNDVKFIYDFSEPNAKQKSLLSIMFNPIKIDNQWYLTLKGKNNYSQEQLNTPHKQSPAPMEITKK